MGKFEEFCLQFGVASRSCPPSVIVKYIRKMVDEKASYQTINLHKSAISKFHEGFQGHTIGTHPLVKQALKAAFRINPPLPKYQHTFDISLLLDYIKNLPPNERLSFKMLTYKTLILTIYASLSRVSSLARLGPSLTENRDHVIVHLCHLEKQSRPGHVRGFLSIPRFPEDPQLCPAEALQEYSAKVSLCQTNSHGKKLCFLRCPLFVVMIVPSLSP